MAAAATVVENDVGRNDEAADSDSGGRAAVGNEAAVAVVIAVDVVAVEEADKWHLLPQIKSSPAGDCQMVMPLAFHRF